MNAQKQLIPAAVTLLTSAMALGFGGHVDRVGLTTLLLSGAVLGVIGLKR